MKKLITLVFSLFLASSLCAQEFNFSQFYANPLNLNPSLAGETDDYRIILNYRKYDFGRRRIGVLSLDRSFQIDDFDKIGIGIRTALNRERSENYESLFGASFSYQTIISEQADKVHLVSVGFEGNGGNDHSFRNKHLYLGFTFGFNYHLKINRESIFLFGASYSSLGGNSFNTILGGEDRYQIHAESNIPLKANLWFTPRLYYVTGSNGEDLSVLFSLKRKRKNKLIELGFGTISPSSYWRDTHFTFFASTEFKRIQFVISRDFDFFNFTSILNSPFETSFIYQFRKNKSIKIPEKL